MVKQDAMIMGETMLEGDLMAMDDAEVSGLFSLSGQVINNK